MQICDIDHLHKRFLDIWEWCMRQGFDTRAFDCELCKHFKYRHPHWECEFDTFEECNYEPKTEPLDKDTNVRSKDEPQTCSVNGRPYTDCCNCEYFKCTADEPQTDWKDQMWAEAVEASKIEPQTDDAYAYDEDDWYDKTERSE